MAGHIFNFSDGDCTLTGLFLAHYAKNSPVAIQILAKKERMC